MGRPHKTFSALCKGVGFGIMKEDFLRNFTFKPSYIYIIRFSGKASKILIIGLEMVRDAFLAHCLGRVPQEILGLNG